MQSRPRPSTATPLSTQTHTAATDSCEPFSTLRYAIHRETGFWLYTKADRHARMRPGVLAKRARGPWKLPRPSRPPPRRPDHERGGRGRRAAGARDRALPRACRGPPPRARTEQKGPPLCASQQRSDDEGAAFLLTEAFDTLAGRGPEDLSAASGTKHRSKSTRWPQSTIRLRLYFHTASFSFKFQQELPPAPCSPLGNSLRRPRASGPVRAAAEPHGSRWSGLHAPHGAH